MKIVRSFTISNICLNMLDEIARVQKRNRSNTIEYLIYKEYATLDFRKVDERSELLQKKQ